MSDTIPTRKPQTSFHSTHSRMTKVNCQCREMAVYPYLPTTPTTPHPPQRPQQQQHQAVFPSISFLLHPQPLHQVHHSLLPRIQILPLKHQDRILWLSSIRVRLNLNNNLNSGMDLRQILISLDHSVAHHRDRVRVDLAGRSNHNSVHHNSSLKVTRYQRQRCNLPNRLRTVIRTPIRTRLNNSNNNNNNRRSLMRLPIWWISCRRIRICIVE
jgi:hypothetical protein